MPAPMTLGAVFNLAIGSISGQKEAQKALAQMWGKATEEGTSDGIGKASKELSGSIRKLHAAGMSGSSKTLKKEYDRMGAKFKSTAKEIAALRKQSAALEDGELKRKLKIEEEGLRHRMGRERAAQKKLLGTADKAAQERMSMIEAHESRMNKSRTESMTEAGESFKGAIEKAISGGFDASSMMEGLMKGLSGAATSRAASVAAAGGGAAGGAEAGGLMAAAGAITAVAAPLAAVVALMVAAYGQQKEMNKALMTGVSAADMGARTGRQLNDSLSSLRETAVDLATEFRTSKEEVTGFITAMNESGVTISQFKGLVNDGSNDIEAFGQVSRMAIIASRGLGVSTSEVADFTSKMYKELGMNLTEIKGAFGRISDEAQAAGMSTKDFFTTINATSAGMALYNFRIEDTIGLMTDMVKILGKEQAAKSIAMEGTFKGMGMQDRLKSTMLSGGKMEKVVKMDAKTQAAAFAKKLSSDGIFKGVTGLSGQTADSLGKMSPREFRKLLSNVGGGEPGMADEAKRQATTLYRLSQGARGGSMNTANAMGDLSKSGELAGQLSQGFGLIGKPLSEANAMDKMVLEQAIGLSADQIDILGRLDMGLRSEFEAMSKADQRGLTFEEALTAGILSNGKAQAAADAASYDLIEQNARDAYKATNSVGDTLSNVIAQTLERISQAMDFMLRMFSESTLFSGFTAKNEQAAKERAASAERQALGASGLSARGEKIAVLEAQKKAEKDPAKKAEYQAQIDEQEAKKKATLDMIEREKLIQGKLTSGKATTAEEARSQIMADKHKETFNKLTPDMLKGAGLSDLVSVTSVGGSDDAAGMATAEEVVNLNELSDAQLQTLDEMLSKQDTEAMSQKMRDIDGQKINEEGLAAVYTAIEDMSKEAAMTQLASLFGAAGSKAISQMQSGDEGAYASGAASLKKLISEGGISEAEKMLLAQAGINVSDLTVSEPKKDFIYRGNGRSGDITPIDKMDSFFGAKPGGAIDKAGGLGGGGGGKTVIVNVYGDDRTYATVKKVLKDTGFGNTRSY